MKSYPMIAVLAIVIAVLLLLDKYRPDVLLYQTECETIDSMRVYAFAVGKEKAKVTSGKTDRYEAEALGVGKVLLYILRDSTRTCPQTGDTLITRTRIRRGGHIRRFDYGLYLRRQGITGTAYAGEYVLKNGNKRDEPSLQERLYKRLEASGLRGDELATTGALTLGYKEDLDPLLRRRFQASGAAHVLAVSGLHTGILYGLLIAILTLGGRLKPMHEDRTGRWLLSCVLIAAMWGYAWLTGMTPSVVRCVVMVTMVEVGKMIYRHSPTLNTIAAAAVLILIVRPMDLWSVSFQLSFAATAAIVIVAQDAEFKLHRLEWENSLPGKMLSWIAGTILISIAAQLGTIPITMYLFGQVSNYFLLTNLIVLPLASLLVPCGLASVALGGSGIGQLIGYLTSGLAWMMNHAVGWIESLPGSSSAVAISLPMVGLLYGAIVMGWLTIHKSLWWLTGVIAATFTFCIVYTL